VSRFNSLLEFYSRPKTEITCKTQFTAFERFRKIAPSVGSLGAFLYWGWGAVFYQWLPGGMMIFIWGGAENAFWTTVGPRESKNDCTAGSWKYWTWEQLRTGF
jgi:hypothetical protein